MSTLEDEMLEYKAREVQKYLYKVMDDTLRKTNPNYYMKRSYGKWTIYDKDGKRVAWRLTKQQADAYMKLLKEE